MKLLALVCAAFAVVFYALSLLDPRNYEAHITMAAVTVPFAGLAGLACAATSRSPAGAGAQSPPRRPAPASHHRRRRR